MQLVTIRQGEDVTFNLMERDNEGQLRDLSLYDNVIVYLWSTVGQFRKFSREEKEKYSPIAVITPTEYRIKLTAEMTKTMNEGTVEMEILVTDPAERSIFQGNVFRLVKSHIKAEV